MPKIKVLVADGEALFREGVCALLKLCEDIEVIGEATNGKETIEMVRAKTPDIVVMNFTMPVIDSAEVTRTLHQENDNTKVLLVSQYEQKELVLSGLKTGANGYIPKRATGAELTSAILAIHRGDYFLHPAIAKTMIEDYSQLAKHQPGSGAHENMTPREKEILRLLAQGYECGEIAGQFNVNTRTILNHRSHIMRKLGMHSVMELIEYALHHSEKSK